MSNQGGTGSGSSDRGVPSGNGPTGDGPTRNGPRRNGPSRRERFRPLELLGLSGVIALVVGLIVMMSTRLLDISLIFAGLSFIVSLVVFAMLALASAPTGEERLDLDEQDRDARH